MKTSTKHTILKISLIVGIFIIIALAIYLPLLLTGALDKIKTAEQLKEVILQGGAYSYVIFFVIQFLQVTLLPIPAAVTTVAGTLVFGRWITIGLSFASIMLASLFSFFLGRKIGKRLVVWVCGEKNFDKWSVILGKGKYVFFLMMLFPIFPDDILCLVVGAATNMTYTFFIVTNLITRPIGIVMTCFLGSGTIIPFAGWGIPVWIVLVVLAGVLFYLSIKYQSKIEDFVVRLSSKFKTKKETSNDNDENIIKDDSTTKDENSQD